MILRHPRTGICIDTNTSEIFNMTDENQAERLTDTQGQTAVGVALAALEARVTELEDVVHKLAPEIPTAGHGVVVAWLEKIGERIKAAVEKL